MTKNESAQEIDSLVHNTRRIAYALEALAVGCRDRIAELEAERESRFDCKGGPGTTTPECRGCTTCLNRTIADLEEWKANAAVGLQALRKQVLDLESQVTLRNQT